ncbi:hypothetical protein [Streptomyces pactum]|uniref:DUF4062 domain-containing protein n=1 Tax=Streptomyces pactum TaxID=68249 RepID=A0A1S6JBJ4_9ACTN|nr:hypothetical protein [Streptomyces pactum]AQS69118.1 hypothetical protein B1H29_21370 [Streptomyces pactum]
MPFDARVIRVMVASPGDVVAERAFMREQCYRWNAAHAERERTVLLPLMWEYDSAPLLHTNGAQAAINDQMTGRADLLVGIFWSRMGTPTAAHDSGTVEEITALHEAGRPVLLYFSTRPLPSDVDVDQLTKVRAFQSQMEKAGLVRTFDSPEEFGALTYDHLTRVLHDRFGAGPERAGNPTTASEPAARLVAGMEVRADTKGERVLLVIENTGTGAAEAVRFTFKHGFFASPLVTHREPMHGLEAGRKVAIPLASLPVSLFTRERIPQLEVTMSWVEHGHRFTSMQTITTS